MITITHPAPGVLQITIDKPSRRNAIDGTGFVQLARAWDELESSDARVGIVTGAGGDFSSGADLATIDSDAVSAERSGAGAEFWRVMHRSVLRDQALRKPVISAIEGVCFGGGMELVGGTHIRIAGRNARFALPEVRHGLIASGGSTARLTRQIPYAIAMEMLLTGREKSGETLAAAGYLSAVVDDGSALTEALRLAAIIADNGPGAIAAILAVDGGGSRDSLTAAYALEDRVGREVVRSAEAREGAAAFLERRSPPWRLASEDWRDEHATR